MEGDGVVACVEGERVVVGDAVVDSERVVVDTTDFFKWI